MQKKEVMLELFIISYETKVQTVIVNNSTTNNKMVQSLLILIK